MAYLTGAGTLAFRSPVVTDFLRSLGSQLNKASPRLNSYGKYGPASRLDQLRKWNTGDAPDADGGIKYEPTNQPPRNDPWAPAAPQPGNENDPTTRRQQEVNANPTSTFDERFGNWPKAQGSSWDEAGFTGMAGAGVPLPRSLPQPMEASSVNAPAAPTPENIPWWIRNGFMQRDPENNHFLDAALAQRAMGSFR